MDADMHSIFLPSGSGISVRTGPVIISKPQLRPDAEIAAQEAICAICGWNQDWICEHSAAKCCSGKQRRAGGLKAALRLVGFMCPLEN
jgi:hypothetical protein